MADFGSNFTEAFSAVMGAGLKARALKTQERREAEEDAYTKSERARVARQRTALGAAGNQLTGDASDTTGFKTPEQYQSDQGLPAAAPTSAEIMSRLNTPGPKGYAPVPTQAQALPQPMANAASFPQAVPSTPAIPAVPPPQAVPATSAIPAAPMAINAPAAAPEATIPATAQGEKAPTFEFKPNAEVANDPAQRNPNVSVTDSPLQASAVSKDGTVTAVAAGTKGVEKKPESGDYVQVNLDGKEVYVPRERTKQLHGSDLLYAKAEAMFGPDGDPVIAAQLYEGAQRVEANNIKLTVQRAEQSIAKAYQVFLSNPQDGLTALAGAINENNLGGLGKVELTWLDNGDAQVRYYAMTANGKHYVNEPKLVKANELVDSGKQLFNQALSSTSGEAITNGVLRDADLATKVQNYTFNRAAEGRAVAKEGREATLFPLEVIEKKANISALNRRNSPDTDLAAKGWTVKVDENGQAYRTNKAGVIQMASSVWNDEFVAPRFKDNTKLAQTMAATAQARGLNIAISPDGIPMYANAQGQASTNPDDVSKPTKPTPLSAPKAIPTAKPLPLTETRAAKLARLKAIIADPKQSNRTKAGAQAQIGGLQNEEVEARNQAARGKNIAASIKKSGLGNADLGSD